MYGQQSEFAAYGGNAMAAGHRFNPNAPAWRAGSFGGQPQQQPQDYNLGYAAADAMGAPHPMNAAMLAAEQHRPEGNHASFSSNNSFSGPSTPATAGVPSSTKRRYAHNPYASSTGSNSEPTSPAMGPAAVSSGRVPAADGFYSGMSSANTSQVQSPVYAPDAHASSGTGYDSASNHPIAFSINEQFAQARGNLAAAACTPRGRHMLVGALRQQHTDKIQAIFEELAPNVAGIIMDPQGGHVVRTLIEFLNEHQVAELVQFLTPEIVLTIATSSQNTRRVLQTLFERHRTPALQPIVDVIATHAIALSTTQQGCIAVMRCIEHTLDVQKQQVLVALQPQLAALTMDPYGNYVAQAVLQFFPRELACDVIEKAFMGHWVSLSCNKFASNVMEKFIQAATPMTRKAILDELVYTTEALTTLMQDGFGNFVLQQIIDTCTTGPEYRKLAERVRPMLGTSPFGHKIEAKLKSKRFGPPYEGARDAPASGAASNANRQNRQAGAKKENEGPSGRRSRGKAHEGREQIVPAEHGAKGHHHGSSRSASEMSGSATSDRIASQ